MGVGRRRHIRDHMLPNDLLVASEFEYPGGLGIRNQDISLRTQFTSAGHFTEEGFGWACHVLPHDCAADWIDFNETRSSRADPIVEDEDVPIGKGGRLMLAGDLARTPMPDDLLRSEIDNDNEIESSEGQQDMTLLPQSVRMSIEEFERIRMEYVTW